jgi:putative oxidoreductase
MTLRQTLDDWSPRMLSVLRVVTALLFMAHGTQKLLGFPASDFAPAAFSLFWFAGVVELLGGAALALGVFTRPVAFVLSGQMAVAYWMAHAPQSPFPVVNGSVMFSNHRKRYIVSANHRNSMIRILLSY